MPTATNDTDILEHPNTATASIGANTETLLPIPRARRGRFPLLTLLRCLLTTRATRHTHMQHYSPQGRDFESPTDLLARKYPDLFIFGR